MKYKNKYIELKQSTGFNNSYSQYSSMNTNKYLSLVDMIGGNDNVIEIKTLDEYIKAINTGIHYYKMLFTSISLDGSKQVPPFRDRHDFWTHIWTNTMSLKRLLGVYKEKMDKKESYTDTINKPSASSTSMNYIKELISDLEKLDNSTRLIEVGTDRTSSKYFGNVKYGDVLKELKNISTILENV
jgi:hypothetical protein